MKKHLRDSDLVSIAINNCYMTHKHGNPGLEEGVCKGIRHLNGESYEECKGCRLLHTKTNDTADEELGYNPYQE